MSRIAFSLALGLLAPAAVAQCFQSNFGTPLSPTMPLTGDVILPIQAIGFTFPLGGTTYSHIHISDKGHAFLSNNGLPAPPVFPDFSATAAEFASGGPRVAPLWADLQVMGANGGEIYLDATAARCTVTWKGLECFLGTCPPFDVQMQLFPSGQVLFFYGPGATNNSDPTQPAWQVAVAGISPGNTTPGTASDLSAGGSTSSDLVFEAWLAPNSFDMAARGLQFDPTTPGYTFLPPAGCANAVAFGSGCVERADSVYEEFAPGAFDLGNTTITWLRTSNGYTMLTSIAGTFVPPSGSAINIAPAAIDGEQVVTLTSPMPVPGGTTTAFNITTKGQVEFASTPDGFVNFFPTGDDLLAWGRTAFHCWHDFDQTSAGSGPILFEQVGGFAYATWNGVHSYSNPVASTFQFQFDRATGNVTLVMLAMNGLASPNPDMAVVGYSRGGPSFDPGETDLSALTGVVDVFDTGAVGLVLDVTGQPRLGSTTFSLGTSNVPNLVPLGFLFFGDTQVDPGIDLTVLGMSGCFGYTNANLGSVSFPVALPAGTGSVLLPIPNNPALVGATLSAQSIAFSLATALNLISSNGMLLQIGN